MEGLSADKLRVLLLPYNEVKGALMPDYKAIEVLTTLKDTTMGSWKMAQIMYTFPGAHKVSAVVSERTK